jgi:hypothetical protein
MSTIREVLIPEGEFQEYKTLQDLQLELLEALRDLLGDRPDVQGGICQRCGRDYIGDFIEGDCPSDDCPAYRARAAIAKATAGTT